MKYKSTYNSLSFSYFVTASISLFQNFRYHTFLLLRYSLIYSQNLNLIMLFSIQSIMAILAFSGSALAIPTHVNQVRQATENVVSLFAYGEDIKGMKLIYGDGLAYIINLGVDASSILSVKSDLNCKSQVSVPSTASSSVLTQSRDHLR